MRGKAVTMLAAVLALVAAACGDGNGGAAERRSVTVYSGRSEEFIGPLIERFERATGIDAEVRYGDTAELAAQILEEGERSPADVFIAQDAGALGAVQEAGRFAALSQSILSRVPETYRSTEGRWVGVSGRARTLAYNPGLVRAGDLPDSVDDLTQPRWKGKLGWAPTNGSFQAFVTALRVLRGEDAARRWLTAMKANGTKAFPKNDAIIEAIDKEEISAGLVNHYYALEQRDEDPSLKVENHFFDGGDPGGLVNVAGAGILAGARNAGTAEDLVEYLVSEDGQRYFATETHEYPLVQGIAAPGLPSLASLEPPQLDLSRLSDLKGTLELLQDVGLV